MKRLKEYLEQQFEQYQVDVISIPQLKTKLVQVRSWTTEDCLDSFLSQVTRDNPRIFNIAISSKVDVILNSLRDGLESKDGEFLDWYFNTKEDAEEFAVKKIAQVKLLVEELSKEVSHG